MAEEHRQNVGVYKLLMDLGLPNPCQTVFFFLIHSHSLSPEERENQFAYAVPCEVFGTRLAS